MTARDLIDLNDPLIVTLNTDDRDQASFDPRSFYVERFWLPIIGPSTTVLIRHLVHDLEHAHGRRTFDLGELSRSVGLGERPGRNSPLMRSITRACDFHLALMMGQNALVIHRRLPVVSHRLLARFPEPLRTEHERIPWARLRSLPGIEPHPATSTGPRAIAS